MRTAKQAFAFVLDRKAVVTQPGVLVTLHSCWMALGERELCTCSYVSCGFAAGFNFPLLQAGFFLLQSTLTSTFSPRLGWALSASNVTLYKDTLLQDT